MSSGMRNEGQDRPFSIFTYANTVLSILHWALKKAHFPWLLKHSFFLLKQIIFAGKSWQMTFNKNRTNFFAARCSLKYPAQISWWKSSS